MASRRQLSLGNLDALVSANTPMPGGVLRSSNIAPVGPSSHPFWAGDMSDL